MEPNYLSSSQGQVFFLVYLEDRHSFGTQIIKIRELKQLMGYFIIIALFFFSFPQCVRK